MFSMITTDIKDKFNKWYFVIGLWLWTQGGWINKTEEAGKPVMRVEIVI